LFEEYCFLRLVVDSREVYFPIEVPDEARARDNPGESFEILRGELGEGWALSRDTSS
jgi:hypothetical protein